MKLLLTVILTLLGLIQSYGQIYEQCLTISGYSENVYDGVNSQNNSTILANSSKELVAIGNNKLYRVSKDGVKLWEKTITTSFKDFSIDKDGGAYTIDNDNIFTKYNSNGTLAWQKSITNVSFSRVVVDVANNVHVLGFNYSLSQLFVIKYLPNGTESWSKLVSNLSNRAMTVSSTGEVYVLGYNFNTGGYQLIKYSSTGSLLWSKVIGYDFGYEQLGVGQDGNLYAFLSDDYSTRVIKFNSANGDNLGEVLIDLGRPVFKQGVDNSFFLVGTSPAGIFAIHKVNLNLVATLFNDTGQFFYERSDYKTIDVESDGTVVANIIFANDDGNKSGYFLRLNPAGVILNSIVFKPATTGLIIDYQGNYLLPTENDCLKKIIHCEKINFSITSQPVNFQGCSGIDAQFSFSVTGIGLSYQWKKGSVLLSDNTKYSGVKTSSLTIKSANATDDPGQYSCDILDGCGRQLTSNSVTLSFISASAITSQPANAGQCAGTEAIFQITTSGGQNVKYQWRKGNVALVEGANVVGSKTNTLTLKTITSAEAGEYYCDVTSDCFTAPLVSQKGVLTVLQPSAILTNPQSASTCVGNTTVFSVMATGANLTYQWKKGGVNLTEGTLTTGTKTNSLTIKDIKSSDAGDYTCTVTGSCGSAVTSAMANLTVNAGSQINTQPVGKTVCAGTQTSFSITASGSSLVYSWKKGNTTLANGGKYSGVNTATLTITSVSATEEGPYTCTITNPCGNDLVSDVAQLSITTTPSITARSADLTLCEDQIALMTVTVTGSGVTYQWKKDGVALTDVNGVTGSKLAELVIAKTKLTDGGNYTCEVASGCGAVVTSAIIKLAVQKDVSITGQPVARKICLGDKTTFSVAVNGAVTSYQWKKNGINITNSSLISGATSASLTITQTSLASQGIYSCEIKTICGNVIVSSGAKLETNPRPDLELLNVNCESFVPEWSSLVIDNNNVFGEYTLYEEGSTTSIPDLLSISGTGVYLIVKSNGVCSDTVEWNNTCIITSVEDALSEISVSPNPSSGIFMIRHPSSVEKIKIYDLKGADVLLLQTANKHETYIDMTQQSAGVYYMALYLHDRIVFQRLIIQR